MIASNVSLYIKKTARKNLYYPQNFQPVVLEESSPHAKHYFRTMRSMNVAFDIAK
jgi:hypothetical protein